MRMRNIMALVMTLLVLGNSAFADTVVLKSGERYTGNVANRDRVQTQPMQQTVLSLFVQESGELRRFAIRDIDYIILEEDGKQQVIDFSGLRENQASARVVRPTYRESSETNAAGLIVVGLGVGALGALYKFGEPKATVTEHSIDVDEHSYNALNYAMIAIGGLLTVIGIAMLGGGTQRSTSFGGRDGLYVQCWPDKTTSGVLVGYGVVF